MSKTAAEILANVDLFADDQREHLLDALAVARRQCPVLPVRAEGGYHLVTRYADVREVLEHPEVFSSTHPGLRPQPVRVIPIDVDPPDHRRYRQFLNPYFSRRFLLRYVDELRQVAREAIDRFIDSGEVEVVGDYATPFVAGSLAQVVFATDDLDLMGRAVEAVTWVAREMVPEAFEAVARLAMEAMAGVEGSAPDREDVVSALVRENVDGRPFTTEERLAMVTTLLLGGLDTTRGVIGNIAYHLATRPEVEQVLRTPGWSDGPLDEFIRFETTVSFMARTVTRHTELAGVPLEPGDRIAVHFSSANRDADRFDRPDELVLDRRSNSHVSFGHGIHRCLGAQFARIQLEIAFDELLARATRFRLQDGTDVPRLAGQPLNAPARLHLSFDRR